MDSEAWKVVLGGWGAVLSTALAAIKIWEVTLKDRVRLRTSYSFSSQVDADDEIVIVNLSPLPLQISHWCLFWKPNFLSWGKEEIDVTPDLDRVGRFTVGARDSYAMVFSEQDRFDWSHRSAAGRKLYLVLHVFGKRRPILLKVGAGQ